jgi:chromosome segregation ATPase
MFRGIISFKSVIILALLMSMTGCKDKEDIEAIKKELAETQADLEHLQGLYNALSIDHARYKAAHRSLVGDVESQKVAEDQLGVAQQVIQQLQLEIQARDETIQQMQLIINDQEATLQEFLDMLGQPSDGTVSY